MIDREHRLDERRQEERVRRDREFDEQNEIDGERMKQGYARRYQAEQYQAEQKRIQAEQYAHEQMEADEARQEEEDRRRQQANHEMERITNAEVAGNHARWEEEAQTRHYAGAISGKSTFGKVDNSRVKPYTECTNCEKNGSETGWIAKIKSCLGMSEYVCPKCENCRMITKEDMQIKRFSRINEGGKPWKGWRDGEQQSWLKWEQTYGTCKKNPVAHREESCHPHGCDEWKKGTCRRRRLASKRLKQRLDQR